MEFVYSDGGRSKYFKAHDVGDCVTRAICNATGLDYKYVYDRLKEMAKDENTTHHRGHKISSVRDGVYKETWKKFLDEIGWKRVKTMDWGDGHRVHLDESELPEKGTFIVQVSKHLTCVKDGVLYDTYDCTRDGERMVYGYYIPMTKDELDARNAVVQAKLDEKLKKDESRALKKQQQAELNAKIKIVKAKYKKKMEPWKKKIRALEREMNKEISKLTESQ